MRSTWLRLGTLCQPAYPRVRVLLQPGALRHGMGQDRRDEGRAQLHAADPSRTISHRGCLPPRGPQTVAGGGSAQWPGKHNWRSTEDTIAAAGGAAGSIPERASVDVQHLWQGVLSAAGSAADYGAEPGFPRAVRPDQPWPSVPGPSRAAPRRSAIPKSGSSQGRDGTTTHGGGITSTSSAPGHGSAPHVPRWPRHRVNESR